MSADRVIAKALSLVGQGYIYGAKGQRCTPAFREQQAQQYPEHADNILRVGAKWDGVPVWDCAQLTRAAAKEAGVELPSGATSQWTKVDWQEHGTIGTLPRDRHCFVYRRQSGSDTTMQHTGVYLGDGSCVHARGTAYGVVYQPVDDYPWTHWAVPAWPETEEVEGDMAKVTAPSGTVNMRVSPSRSASIVDRLAIGTEIEVLASVEAGGEQWRQIRHNGRIGYMMAEFIAEDAPPGGEAAGDALTITLPKNAAEALLAALRGVLDA